LKERGKTFLLGSIRQFGLLYNLLHSRTVIMILCKSDIKDSTQCAEYTDHWRNLLKSVMSRPAPYRVRSFPVSSTTDNFSKDSIGLAVIGTFVWLVMQNIITWKYSYCCSYIY